MARSKGQEVFFHTIFFSQCFSSSFHILIVNLSLDSFASNIIAFIAKNVRFLRAHQKNFFFNNNSTKIKQ